jgi:hypothetical protein
MESCMLGTNAAKLFVHTFFSPLLYSSHIKQDYVYNPRTQVGVSYDSPRAFGAKGSFIKSNKLRGFAMWEMGGDSKDQLIDAIRETAGFGYNSCSEDGVDVQARKIRKRNKKGKKARKAGKKHHHAHVDVHGIKWAAAAGDRTD